MEDQAVSMVLRGGEMTLRMAKETGKGMMQVIALIRAMINKYQHTGQVPVKWLTKQYDTNVYTIPREYLADFKASAKEINMMYAVTESHDPKLATIVIRQQDIHNFNYITGEIGVVENDVKVAALNENAKDEGILTEEHEGKDFYSFTLPRKDSVAFQQMADRKNIIYATPQDIGAPTDYLKKSEILKESYATLVERNKDNSEESRWVHQKHWPNLQTHDKVEVISINEEQYEQFKTERMGKIPFAAAVKNGEIQLAYRSEDRAAVQESTGESKYKTMVGRDELNARMREQAEKGDHSFIVPGDQRGQVQEIMNESGISVPEMTKVAHGEKYFEDLDHRIERVKRQTEYAKEKEKGSMDRQTPQTETDYCIFGLREQEAEQFRDMADARGISFIEEPAVGGGSQFLTIYEQKDMALKTIGDIGINTREVPMEDIGKNTMYIQMHFKPRYGAELQKLDRKRAEIRQAMREASGRAAEIGKSAGEGLER